jgi:acyl-CoA reductase-like NAD-dependent aldehyde dehydrogenase
LRLAQPPVEMGGLMAELCLDGSWASARSGARREIRCPADGSLVAESRYDVAEVVSVFGHHGRVAAGLAEGAVLRCGGARPDDPALADGHYYLPTAPDGCTSDMSVTQEESLGPVLTIETFTDEDEAVRVANDSVYGLAGAVWFHDYHPYVPQAEWGGFKQAGIGRELGAAGLDEYRETKHVWHNIRPAAQHWFAG